MSNTMELYNGQVWRQAKYPNYQIMVVMLNRVNRASVFCKMNTDYGMSPPLVMVEENGTLYYSEKVLLANLRELGYSPVGEGRIKKVAGGRPDC